MESLSNAQLAILLDVARASIKHGLSEATPLPITLDTYPEPLNQPGAAFVTLLIDNNLRGCIGTLEAYRPLIVDVAANAFASAFSDPRFAPLSDNEFNALDVHLSILNPPEQMHFTSETHLLEQIRPYVDGLILTEGSLKGTFLPSVWESLPTAEAFLSHLKQKAGLPQHYWSDTLRIQRYTTTAYP